MNEQQNIETVQKGYTFFGKGDIANLLNEHTEDTEYVFPGPQDMIPYAGTYQGQKQVQQFFSRLNDSIELTQFQPKEFFAQGDKVVVMGQSNGRVKSTGSSISEEWVHVFTIREGKVARLQSFSDTAKTAAGFRQEMAQTEM